jgi:hypothetical protein
MASEALNWALANGMTQAEFDRNIFNAVLDAQKNNTSNALLRIEMDRLGISPEDVARATGVTTQSVASQYTAAVPKTEAELIANAAADAELAARTARDRTASQSLISARNLEATTSVGTLTAAQKAAADAAQLALITRQNEAALALQQRNAAAAAAAAEAKRIADNEAAYQKYVIDNQAKSDAQIAANQRAYEAYLANQAKLAGQQGGTTTGTVTGTGLLGTTGATSVTGTLPFANATQGFAQNFNNYTSIPIGAQYNPNVMGGQQRPTTPTGQSAGLTWGLNNGMTQAQIDKNIFDFVDKNRNLTDTQLRNEMDRYGISPGDVARATGVPAAGVQSRYDASNVAGGSPYSQVMAQMRPVGNPYAGVIGGQAMGGYNPALYDQILAANAAKADADAAAARRQAVEVAGGGDAAGDAAAATAAATAAANAANAAAAVTGESVSVSGETGESVSGIYNKGGIVDGLFGINPPGPDDGAGYLDRGEYVIKKSSVNKYGRGLLDMINEGKVPAKKMKSLLG